MPRISAEEKENATLIPLERILSDVDDTESSFNDFRAGFDQGEEPGIVRAYELEIDEHGKVGTTKMQTRLGSWPIDAYKFDELCNMIIELYMTLDQQRMAVRLVGTDPKKTGYVFNKIVMLKRALKKESSSTGTESTSSIMKLMQEMNEKNMAMIARLQAPREEKPDSMAELQRLMVFAQTLNNPMNEMMKLLLPALAGRPAPAASDPFGSITGLIDVAERLSDLRGGGDSGGGNDDSIAGIIRSIVPVVKPALEALPALAAMSARQRPPARIAAPATGPANPAAPTPSPSPTTPTIPTGPTVLASDIPSGDSEMLAQLKPQIDSLVSMASQGSDPTGAANLIFDQVFMDPRLPDEIFEKLSDFVDSETFVNYVIVMNPAAKPHAAWFETFKAQVIKRLNAETISADQPTPQPPVASG
jgi:hypothetical protein